MSIIFGVANCEGNMVEERQVLDLAQATSRYALDGNFVRAKGQIGMGFQPYHTHQRSNLESQPLVDSFGNMLTFDGRIDNHEELCELLNLKEEKTSDSAIVLASFRKWAEECFARLTGDWSLALWSRRDRSLYLARDHAGTRSLYFEHAGPCIRWSTYLETFFAKGESRSLDEKFAICYISGAPRYDLTPYKGILEVTPAHFIRFQENSVLRRRHWQWLQSKDISYSSDAEYEAHFVSVFRQAVLRRTGAGAPILAELSGGMDSTSIVCMSDRIRSESSNRAAEILDTVSYYDDSEPDWNERKYFEITEQQRGKRGFHLCTSIAARSFQPPAIDPGSYLLPGADLYTSQREAEFRGVLDLGGYRVVLSGTGGDEVLGGVPSSDPELADYLASGKLASLLNRAFEWCLIDRTPLSYRVFGTARYLLNLYGRSDSAAVATPGWLRVSDGERVAVLDTTAPMNGKKLVWRPSSLSNAMAWWSVLAAMPSPAHRVDIRYESRYPYLDKDLVNFLFRIPRNQIVQPGRRRSLMRRAMREIVPHAVLERPRKGFIRRAMPALFQAERMRLQSLFQRSSLESHGLIETELLQKALRTDDITPDVSPILRAGWLELWLQSSSSRISSAAARSRIDARTVRA